MPAADFAAILRLLAEHSVDFVVVGGSGAVLQVMTFGLEAADKDEPASSTGPSLPSSQ